MKQIQLILIVILSLFIFSGCTNSQQKSKNFDFDVPAEITLQKDIILFNSEENSSYSSLIITEQSKINQIITSLNDIEYETSTEIYDLAGYQYTIEWDTVKIYVINDDHFYFNNTNTTYEIIKGNFDFLDDFTFQLNSSN